MRGNLGLKALELTAQGAHCLRRDGSCVWPRRCVSARRMATSASRRATSSARRASDGSAGGVGLGATARPTPTPPHRPDRFRQPPVRPREVAGLARIAVPIGYAGGIERRRDRPVIAARSFEDDQRIAGLRGEPPELARAGPEASGDTSRQPVAVDQSFNTSTPITSRSGSALHRADQPQRRTRAEADHKPPLGGSRQRDIRRAAFPSDHLRQGRTRGAKGPAAARGLGTAQPVNWQTLGSGRWRSAHGRRCTPRASGRSARAGAGGRRLLPPRPCPPGIGGRRSPSARTRRGRPP